LTEDRFYLIVNKEKMRRKGFFLGFCIIGWILFFCSAIFAESLVEYKNGLLTIKAQDEEIESLIKEIGEKCNIKIVLYGELKNKTPVNIQFSDLSPSDAIRRVLKAARIKNYLFHFEEALSSKRLARVDIIGSKGIQRELTQGRGSQEVKTPLEEEKSPSEKGAKVFKLKVKREQAEKLQEQFLSLMQKMLEGKMEKGEEPDPSAVLKMFKEMIPPEVASQLPKEVLEELKKAEEKSP